MRFFNVSNFFIVRFWVQRVWYCRSCMFFSWLFRKDEMLFSCSCKFMICSIRLCMFSEFWLMRCDEVFRVVWMFLIIFSVLVEVVRKLLKSRVQFCQLVIIFWRVRVFLFVFRRISWIYFEVCFTVKLIWCIVVLTSQYFWVRFFRERFKSVVVVCQFFIWVRKSFRDWLIWWTEKE